MASFDVTCSVDMNEVKNAINQVLKEIGNRFDFKGSQSKVELLEKEGVIAMETSDGMKLKAMQDILRQRFSKRDIDPKVLSFEEEEVTSSGRYKQSVRIKTALSDDETKKIVKAVKQLKLKVSAQIQGDTVRVSGKKKDDLQEVIAHLRKEFDALPLQFGNYRD